MLFQETLVNVVCYILQVRRRLLIIMARTCLWKVVRNTKKPKNYLLLTVAVLLGSLLITWRILTWVVHPCYLPVSLVKPDKFLEELHTRRCRVVSRSPDSFTMEAINPELRRSEHHYIMLWDARGRVGNMMFQIAGAYGYARALGYKLYIDDSHPLLPFFELQPSKKMKLTNVVELKESECRSVVWKCYSDILTRNLSLNGWFQSWKYFSDVSQTIRDMFTIKSRYLDQAKAFLQSKVPANKTRVGIHVRRGDLLTEERINCGNFVATAGYIYRAMEYFRSRYSNVMFVVVSEDIPWCKENIISHDVIYSPFREPVIDLAIMTLCRHMIVTIGTFGWWGAWLGGGQAVYVKEFPRKNSWVDNFGMYKEDYYPPGWVGLSNYD